MMQFYLLREQLRNFYGKYALYIVPVCRFVLALTALILMDANMGYQRQLGSLPVMLGLSLICALLPWRGLTLVLGLCLLVQFSAVSMEVTLIAAVLFFFIWIMHMILLPEGGMATVLIPILFFFRIPYLVPILLALSGSLTGAVPVAFGVVIYYLIQTVTSSASVLTNGASLSILQRFTQILTGLKDNQVMFVMLAAFLVVYLVVYLIRQISADYSRVIAIITGSVVNALVLLVGELVFQIDTSSLPIVAIIAGSLICGVIAIVIDFFIFAVDYNRTEYVQFEDDDYYYYVKAVPKITVTAPDKQVKKINSRTEKRPVADTGRKRDGEDEIWD